MDLKRQTGLARRFGQFGNPTVKLISTPIEFNLGDPRSFGSLGDRLTNEFCGSAIASHFDLFPQIFVARTGRRQCAPCLIVDNLAIDMAIAAENGHTRAG
jgi:hypothetical protein